MAPEGSGRGERPEDDIDARFEEIVSGLRAEQAESVARRREAIRRAQLQRRHQERQENRPLEGFDDPNPWPPSRRGVTPPGANPLRPDVNPPLRNFTPPPDAPRGAAPPPADPPRGATPPPPGPPDDDLGSGPPQEAWRGWDESDEEEHFIPPTPSLPAGDLHLWSIVAGLLGGPLILILSEVFRVLRADWWTPVGLVVSVVGVVLLVLRLPKNRDYTDSSGGARV
ncbi:hypothetical protein [Ornithinimicrobium cryptoxanthini]|uniref:Uncharacterized protein n=1 Tax=Ornithinimicrobium cryptoxanthini TaxID=2934161 RepID=A0ABY4YM20_9MICO|nr:hypothetical protein [Ornithinimicrobium cryptoxanthini]USQ77565.1 hypothetical protein NF557_06570 [Ornithinimicrobium cryptoxanthini]